MSILREFGNLVVGQSTTAENLGPPFAGGRAKISATSEMRHARLARSRTSTTNNGRRINHLDGDPIRLTSAHSRRGEAVTPVLLLSAGCDGFWQR